MVFGIIKLHNYDPACINFLGLNKKKKNCLLNKYLICSFSYS